MKLVVDTFQREVNQLWIIIFDSDTIKATGNHPFLVNNDWKYCSNIEVGDSLISVDKEFIKVREILKLDTTVIVYNFEVEDFHTYFVGSQNVIVHNDCPTDPKGGGKNAQHGDGGRQLSKAEKQLKQYEEQLKNATGREAKQIRQKMKNVQRAAEKAKSGENHSRNAKGN